MVRIFALLILVVPGFLAGYGIKIMRDMTFAILQPPFPALWVQGIVGLLFTVLGIAFVAGFILHRDRKRNNVQKRFQKQNRATR